MEKNSQLASEWNFFLNALELNNNNMPNWGNLIKLVNFLLLIYGNLSEHIN